MARGFDQGYRIRPVIPRHGLLGYWPVGEATEQRKKHHRVAGPNCSRAEPHFLDLALGPLYPQTLYHDSAALDFVRLSTCRWVEAMLHVGERVSFVSRWTRKDFELASLYETARRPIVPQESGPQEPNDHVSPPSHQTSMRQPPAPADNWSSGDFKTSSYKTKSI
jgi:hypothetical protein